MHISLESSFYNYLADGITNDRQEKLRAQKRSGSDQKGTAKNTKQSSEKRCFRCGELGNISRDCDHKNNKCFKCQKFGHIEKDCTESKAEQSNGEKSEKSKNVKRVCLKDSDLNNVKNIFISEKEVCALFDGGTD